MTKEEGVELADVNLQDAPAEKTSNKDSRRGSFEGKSLGSHNRTSSDLAAKYQETSHKIDELKAQQKEGKDSKKSDLSELKKELQMV